MPELLDDLIELLRIPSVSAGRPNPDAIRQAAEWVKARVERSGGEAALTRMGPTVVMNRPPEAAAREASPPPAPIVEMNRPAPKPASEPGTLVLGPPSLAVKLVQQQLSGGRRRSAP